MSALAPCPYKLGKELGEGSYAIVKECVHIATNTKYAAKIFNKKLILNKQHIVLNEINILQQLGNNTKHTAAKKESATVTTPKFTNFPDSILKLIDYFESVNNLYIIMDLASEDLFDKMMRGVTEQDTITTIKRILSALDFLHSNSITHRDLKPENILLRVYDDCNTCMVGDFGLAKLLNINDEMKTLCGTPGYMAPEVLDKKEYSNSVDVWSLGCIAYFMQVGDPPFEKPQTLDSLKAILNVDVSIPEMGESTNFIKHCLKRDPNQRMTVPECLDHPWLTGKDRSLSNVGNQTITSTNLSRKRWKKAIDAVKFIKLINKKTDDVRILVDIPGPIIELEIQVVIQKEVDHDADTIRDSQTS
eukprot:NODE_145_length_15762_cov_0.655238.p5 type:complete len:361 gc:universal NODE_145_length_15762_cov_0.655238:12160-11078(-)